ALLLGEEAAHLQVRVPAEVHLAEQLHDQLAAEAERGVALLAPQQLGLETLRLGEDGPQGAGGEAAELAARGALEPAPREDEVEQSAGELPLAKRVVDHARLLLVRAHL